MKKWIFKLKRWIKMLLGNSIDHVEQNIGKIYSTKELKGYYNDLTQKVTKSNLPTDQVPKAQIGFNDYVDFPIAVFQYGLGAYDLFLLEGELEYFEKFMTCVKWACETIDDEGRWNNFHYIYPDNPYSSMAQSEGVSLLLRAFNHTDDDRYLDLSRKAIKFMLSDFKLGGTTRYKDNEVYLLEYTHKVPVLNGWIFSIFSLFDYLTIEKDDEVLDVLQKTINTLEDKLDLFGSNFWSYYNLDKSIIASPFYHNLHIALVDVLYDLTGREKFKLFSTKMKYQQKSKISSFKAFIIKVLQKLKEK